MILIENTLAQGYFYFLGYLEKFFEGYPKTQILFKLVIQGMFAKDFLSGHSVSLKEGVGIRPTLLSQNICRNEKHYP